MIAYLQMFGVSLGLTVLIELAVARYFGLKTRDLLLVVLLVNVLTNPAAVWMHVFLEFPQIPVELLVVITEYYVYRQFQITQPLRFSLVANGISWGLGLILQMF